MPQVLMCRTRPCSKGGAGSGVTNATTEAGTEMSARYRSPVASKPLSPTLGRHRVMVAVAVTPDIVMPPEVSRLDGTSRLRTGVWSMRTLAYSLALPLSSPVKL